MNIAVFYRHDQYVLDASSVINFFGSGYMSEIFGGSPVQFSVSSYVKEREACTILSKPDNNGHRQCIPIHLEGLISEGLLAVIDNSSPAVANNVIILGSSGIKGMGEKISAALAMDNNWGLVLDDKRAMVKLEPFLPHIQMLTTFDVLKFWAIRHGICGSTLCDLLCNIIIRGNYRIAKDHPHFNWVKSHGG